MNVLGSKSPTRLWVKIHRVRLWKLKSISLPGRQGQNAAVKPGSNGSMAVIRMVERVKRATSGMRSSSIKRKHAWPAVQSRGGQLQKWRSVMIRQHGCRDDSHLEAVTLDSGVKLDFFFLASFGGPLFFWASFRGPCTGVHVGDTDGRENLRDKPVWVPGACGRVHRQSSRLWVRLAGKKSQDVCVIGVTLVWWRPQAMHLNFVRAAQPDAGDATRKLL